MSNIYLIIMLIGIPCVFFGTYVLLKVEIDLVKARWRNLKKNSREKRKDKYIRTRKLYRRMKKLNAYLLVGSIIVSSMYFMSASVFITVDVEPILTEKIKKVYNDPKDRLVQNTEVEIKDIFIDYLFFSWFKEEEGRTKEQYREKVDELFDGKEPIADASEGNLEGKDKEAYDTYVEQQNEIDLAKVPEGATLDQVRRGEVSPKKLTVAEYKEEHSLWKKRYLLCPAAANLQQMARAAVDVQTTMMQYPEYKGDWDEIVKYAVYGIQAYLALMLYISSGESKADCCYWIAKVFLDLAEKMPIEYAEYVEHCYLMAYTFADKGLSYKEIGQQEDDHISDMIDIRNKADKALAAY